MRAFSPSLKLVLVCSCLILLTACAGTPGVTREHTGNENAAVAIRSAADPCTLPTADSSWEVAPPASLGFSPDKLCNTLRDVAGGSDNVHGLLVERHGKLLAEIYRNGTDTPINSSLIAQLLPGTAASFSADTLHDVRSVSKSVIGLLTGITIGRGQLHASDKVLDHYPELGSLRTEGREEITVQHLLTMSAGLEWQEMSHGWLTSSETPLLWRRQAVSYYLNRTLVTRPGEVFNYAGGATMVLADLLVRVNGRPLEQLVQEDLFGPLGITRWEWVPNLRGVPMAYAGLRLLPRDMLKLGRLANAQGRWQGRQVVPQTWIADMQRQHVPARLAFMGMKGGDVGYGYQWWNGTVDWHGKTLRWSAAIGNGGQRIAVVPALDLTVVVTAGEYGSPAIQKAVGRIVAAVLDDMES
ncbi:serine hydrolase domain-containing protein [Noviherbaspirillum galbum]|uniref:Serine hydrolase n=1 Tax=Noviherbaspirillum galbum TaxID=2709383 RepID=A0A6B3SVS4_9BURK|nr:serine hydrolase [Noviherbaspirillum galbum]NEX64744.1 serine hydrolase [Noviherbaspirillum galbum]